MRSCPLLLINVHRFHQSFAKAGAFSLCPNDFSSLLRMPYGCAEQTMVTLAPNIFVLQYLEARGKDTPEVRRKAYQHMSQGQLATGG